MCQEETHRDSNDINSLYNDSLITSEEIVAVCAHSQCFGITTNDITPESLRPFEQFKNIFIGYTRSRLSRSHFQHFKDAAHFHF